MNREEKLQLSAETEYGHAFRQGLFAKLYEQCLWHFVHAVRPLKPMRERVKGSRDDVVYGGLPIKSFEALISAGGLLAGAEVTEYGWRWPWPADETERQPYEEWRGGIEAAAVKAVSAGRDILAELATFNLALHTPMEVMNTVLGWQEFLRKEVSS